MRAGMEERTMSRLGSVLKLEATWIMVSALGVETHRMTVGTVSGEFTAF